MNPAGAVAGTLRKQVQPELLTQALILFSDHAIQYNVPGHFLFL
jgi:hypothetical protein